MKGSLILYHGSNHIITNPTFGLGKEKNDYGKGFYCTENIELAKEWSCPTKENGIVNKYILDLSDLNILYLTRGEFNILNWLALLLKNRTFDISSPLANSARNYIIANFLPVTDNIDIVIGYRADDSYFSFAEDFVNNLISLRDLNKAMQLGKLGEQVVLISEKSFSKIKFIDSKEVKYEEYYYKRNKRDLNARNTYLQEKHNLKQFKNDIYILDILREEMSADDQRLRSIISE